MKRVLVLYYSQTGQLTNVVNSFTKPLLESSEVEVVYQKIEPEIPYPFPWNKLEFFDIFPESVYMDGCEIREFEVDEEEEFDLVILAYTVWFLSPSIPITGFLNSKYAKLLKNRPVITLIACRNMWIMAQEKVKKRLEKLGATLIDNVVLVDQGSSMVTFITTPRWMWTGKKGAFWGFPRAGVSQKEIARASRFGLALRDALSADLEREKKPLLVGLEAVKIEEKTISVEKVGHRSFLIWGKLVKLFGKTGAVARIPILGLYFLFLLTAICTIVPILMLTKPIIRAINRKNVIKERTFFEMPSGRGDERLREYSE
ncbi:dialkylresorcinol condensing enzyme [Sulfurovum sp. bin170]|uniref:dialkylrecorsinol condensing enzyme n=1 Tax=Sulfurovum sp. bin170 TaxID=2695268 RepID=UPI0013DEB5E7|nr:dialkylrecorsinol condensing enzyme [Sulfurovum sp. bin170]NEW60919.1 dialkylresorcinol condensing enzyme [Sulfurovum sp. bin170]